MPTFPIKSLFSIYLFVLFSISLKLTDKGWNSIQPVGLKITLNTVRDTRRK